MSNANRRRLWTTRSLTIFIVSGDDMSRMSVVHHHVAPERTSLEDYDSHEDHISDHKPIIFYNFISYTRDRQPR